MGKVSFIGICFILLFSIIGAAGAVSMEKLNKLNISETSLWDPVLSPDGSKIAYAAYDTAQNQQIFVMNADGSDTIKLTNSTNKKWGLSWGPEKIAYLSFGKDNLEKIFVINPNGSENKQLISDNTRQGNADEDKPPAWSAPSWSMDGKFLVYTSLDNASNQKLYMVNSDGTGKRPIYDDNFRQWSPSISPDGKSIVYVSYTEKYIAELFITGTEGSARRQITFDGIKKNYPVWGPDGTIVYVSYEKATSSGEKIFSVVEGKERTIFVTDSDFRQRSPSFSKDGTKFAYADIDISGLVKIATADITGVTSAPALITSIATVAPAAAPTETGKEASTATPAVTQTEKPVQKEIPENKEVPVGNTLKQVVILMLLVLGIIVLVMFGILAASNFRSKK
ncbi:MAG: PD40 domain-containing protein [Candidatus Methanoperedens sp.]|nr:PD40 domain-containing protein [Candidatus Methanoperedens sp.]MCE8425030.1 PD40 domain-containing protein [Candidatus Methanoperedens sp.]MCE8427222.1 PD40 domain-containing protein [Candidatus Methanoperedens sp.]